MPKAKATSPARSQGDNTTPKRRTTRGSRSLCSPALSTASGRLTSLIDQFKDKNMESFALSPLNGRSVLNDNTEIEEPRRKSWWKKLGENSQDVMEVLEDNQLTDVNDMIEDFIDIEVLSQGRNNYTLDLPESSDNESINSIVLPQRRLFTQKENQPQKKYGHLIDNRESLAKLHKTNTTNIEKTVNVGTRELFQNTKRSKPIFPAALLNLSPNKTKENMLVEPRPQVRNIFGNNRQTNKRKNMFTDFIVSESEDEIPDIQPKIFGFQKKIEQRRISSISKGRDTSPASSITTDIEMDFRMLLPSSTMVENQLEDNMLPGTPIKRARLSKLSEAKESEAGTNTIQTNTTGDKTKQSNKSVSSKNKSKASPEIRDISLNSSRTTRSMFKNFPKRDENVNISVKQDTKSNKSLGKNSRKDIEINVSVSKSFTDKLNVTLNKSQKQSRSKARNSPKAIENEIEPEENVVNAINNVTRVINKSTNRSLPNTTAINKSVHEKEHTVTIKVHKTGSNDVEQNEQEEDENNFTLEYENDDNENVEEAVVHNELNEKQKYNIKTHNTVVLEKEIQETEINKSKSNKSRTNKSMQKEPKPAKAIEESVESQTEQYSANDNIDGNVEKKQEMINQVMGEDVNNGREVSIEQIEQEYEKKLNISRKVQNEGGYSAPDVTQSKKMEDDLQIDSPEAKPIEKNENDDQANESQDLENYEEEIEADVNQIQKMEDDLQIDRAKGKAIEKEYDDQVKESEADTNKSHKMEDDLRIENAEAEAIERDQNDDQTNESQDNESDKEESESDVNQIQKMEDDLQKIGYAKGKAIEKEYEDQANESEADVNESHKMNDDLQINSAEAEAIERDQNGDQTNESQDNESDEEESEADVDQIQKMEDDLQIYSAKGKAIEKEYEDLANESHKMDDDLQINSAEAEAIERVQKGDQSDESQNNESDEEESEADVNQSHKMEDNLQIDSAKGKAIEKEYEDQANESEADVNESHKMDDDLQIDSAEAEAIERDQNDDQTDESQDNESEDDINKSHKMEDDLEIDSAEADKAMASDPETSDIEYKEVDEMEIDDDEEESEHTDESEQNQNESHEKRQNEPSTDEIEQSPDVTHDTTGRYRNKDFNKSPEVILHDKTNQMDSFIAEGRNSSVRKTKSMINNLNIHPSLAPPRDSTGFSNGATNSSAEGSGWDSHRTTRKTLRQTFGKDFTPRKSLRALVMEKSAKRQTEHMAKHSETVKFPLANSTEMPEDSNHYVEDIVESDHEVSRRTRQTTLELYLEKIKEQNIEKKLKMEQAIRNSLKGPVRDSLSLFKVPNKPAPRRPKPAQSKPKKQIKSSIPFDELPAEVIEDMKYKPPKRFQPTNASWITKRLYKFLETKLEPKYDYKARVRAEKLVETIYHFAKDLRRHDTAPVDAVEVLKHELARLDVVRTHFDFYEFFHEFMPREIRVKVVPDIVNKIPLPRHGVFSDILRGNTVQG